ncbi:MAG: hypothetical protein ACK8QZ_11790, partial [Anaerolineales bacterium]
SGVTHDPARVAGLANMQMPTTVGELQQFLGAAGWLRGHIVDYAERVRDLQALLNQRLAALPKRS